MRHERAETGGRVSWRPVSPSGRRSWRLAARASQRWLKEHFSDPYVKKAQAEGLRSRAAYKLEELVDRDRLLKPGMVVVDLGAAPEAGRSWVRQELDQMELGLPETARRGRVIASDILEMPSLAGVEFLHGDFREDAVLSKLLADAGRGQVDLVLSDMAPNKSGVDAVDQPRAMYLAELARWTSPTAVCGSAGTS
jgi:23S rRNA (uridine2552-2'-O)-methyltransferase